MAKVYKLEKEIWTEADFENMSWHDVTIHALSYSKDYDLLLDIDHIFEWVQPKKDSEHYFKYWIAPCTLIFKNTSNIVFDLGIAAPHQRKIDGLYMEPSETSTPEKPMYDWAIETLQGEITFQADSYKQYVRQQPIIQLVNELELDQRGGLSFDTAFN
jgi:hypothetical protein